MLSKNKGEWSEVLVLARAIVDGEFPVVDSELRPTRQNPIQITNVALRRSQADSWSHPTTKNNESPVDKYLIEEISDLAAELQKELLQGKSSSFASFSGNRILKLLSISENQSKDKVDIWFKVISPLDSSGEWLGFSIKSHVGGASSLLNASSKTNFKFRVWHEDTQAIDSLFGSTPIQRRISTFISSGGHLELASMSSAEFEYNLDITDQRLKTDIAELLVDYYSSHRNRIPDLVKSVSLQHPDPDYETKLQYRIRRFLLNIALGMVPGTRWNARLQAYGGYLVVTSRGSVVCLPATNSDNLGDYIFHKCYLDTPSTTRHQFGTPFEENGATMLDLNLQIRFRNV